MLKFRKPVSLLALLTALMLLELPSHGAFQFDFEPALGQMFVVAVGANDYGEVNLLKGAEADAEAIADTLGRLKRDPKPIQYLFLGKEATKAAIVKAVEDAKHHPGANEHSTLVFGFAGIGANGALYLPGFDADEFQALSLSAVGNRARSEYVITAAEVSGWVEDWPGHLLIIVDAVDGSLFTDDFVARNAYRSRGSRGVCVLTAGPMAREMPRVDRGLFSFSLTKGLETGDADLDGDKYVASSELEAYVATEGHTLSFLNKEHRKADTEYSPRGYHLGAPFKICFVPNSEGRKKLGSDTKPKPRAYPLAPSFAEKLPPPGKVHALLIGVTAYPGGDITSLPYPENDVLTLANALKSPQILGVPPENIKVLSESSEKKPTTEEIELGFRWLSTRCQPDDTALIYFAGHGGLRDSKPYLLARNSKIATMRTTALRVDIFNELVEDVSARTKLVILDCCHSGGFSKTARSQSALSREMYESLHKISAGEFRLFSCGKNEFSYPIEEFEQGVFSSF